MRLDYKFNRAVVLFGSVLTQRDGLHDNRLDGLLVGVAFALADLQDGFHLALQHLPEHRCSIPSQAQNPHSNLEFSVINTL